MTGFVLRHGNPSEHVLGWSASSVAADHIRPRLSHYRRRRHPHTPLTPPIDRQCRSLGDELIGVDKHEVTGVQQHRPPSGRVSETLAADLHGLGRDLTEILNDDTSALGIGARIHPDAHVHRQLAVSPASDLSDGQTLCAPWKRHQLPLPVHHRWSAMGGTFSAYFETALNSVRA